MEIGDHVCMHDGSDGRLGSCDADGFTLHSQSCDCDTCKQIIARAKDSTTQAIDLIRKIAVRACIARFDIAFPEPTRAPCPKCGGAAGHVPGGIHCRA